MLKSFGIVGCVLLICIISSSPFVLIHTHSAACHLNPLIQSVSLSFQEMKLRFLKIWRVTAICVWIPRMCVRLDVFVFWGCRLDLCWWYKQFTSSAWDRTEHEGVRRSIFPAHAHTKCFPHTYFHLEVGETEAGSSLCPVSWSEEEEDEEEGCERDVKEEYSRSAPQWRADCVSE